MLLYVSSAILMFWFLVPYQNVLPFSDIERYDCATGYLKSKKTNNLAIQQLFSELDDCSQKKCAQNSTEI